MAPNQVSDAALVLPEITVDLSIGGGKWTCGYKCHECLFATMSPEPYVESDAYAVSWDPELAAVVHEWHETPTEQAFRDGVEDVLSLIEARDARKILSDCRALDSFTADDEWLREEWVPRLVSAGVESLAVVYPEDSLAKFELDKTARTYTDLTIETMFATDVPEARAWLQARA